LSLYYKNASSYKPIDIEELACSELVAFIDESLEVEEPAVLELSDLVKFYSSKLSELGGEHPDKIHGATREKSLIDTFYKLGMCISYDRLLSILPT